MPTFRELVIIFAIAIFAHLLLRPILAHGQEVNRNKLPFIVNVFDLPPFINVTGDEMNARANGISVDLWNAIANRNGWHTERFVSHNDFGDYIHPMNIQGYNTISIGSITMTANRESNRDFTVPFYHTGLSIAVHERDVDNKYVAFLYSFLINMGFAVSILIFHLSISGTIFYFLEKKVSGFSWTEGLYWAAVTNTTTGYGDISPKSHYGKIWCIFYMYASFFLNISFIGLASANSVYHFGDQEVFQNLRDKNICVLEESASLEYLIENNIQYSERPTMEECIDMVEQGNADAFMADLPSLIELAKEYDFLVVSDKIYRQQSYAFLLPEGNEEILEKINMAMISIMQEDWFFERINSIH
jgi:ABC-type amino acid transport substrate-binding protein